MGSMTRTRRTISDVLDTPDPTAVPCPKCFAPAWEPCRAASGRTTAAHAPRLADGRWTRLLAAEAAR